MASTAIPMWDTRVPRGVDGVIKFIDEGAAPRRKLTDEAPRGILRLGEYKMSNALEVNDSDFESQIEQHKGLAVVDFWATWCAPCRMVAPLLDQLAVEYEGKAKVAKVDVDVNIKTSTKFNVRSIPAILFFKDGKLVDQVIGFVGKPALAEKFKQHAA